MFGVDLFPETVSDADQADYIALENHIRLVQYGLLKASLEQLLEGRSSSNTKREVLTWLESNNTSHPYSFLNCASSFDGLSVDPYEVRELVINEYFRCNPNDYEYCHSTDEVLITALNRRDHNSKTSDMFGY